MNPIHWNFDVLPRIFIRLRVWVTIRFMSFGYSYQCMDAVSDDLREYFDQHSFSLSFWPFHLWIVLDGRPKNLSKNLKRNPDYTAQ
jgi:hypothetical protein